MIQIILVVVFLIILLLLLFSLAKFYKLIRSNLMYLANYIQDVRVDGFFHKAVIIGELQTARPELSKEQQVSAAYEKSISIVTDVLLQNGYDPRQYNLKALVLVKRLELGLITENKEVTANGKG